MYQNNTRASEVRNCRETFIETHTIKRKFTFKEPFTQSSLTVRDAFVLASVICKRKNKYIQRVKKHRKHNPHGYTSIKLVPGKPTQCSLHCKLTLHLTSFFTTFTLASQKAPRYLALTSVPTVKNGGSSEDCAWWKTKERKGTSWSNLKWREQGVALNYRWSYPKFP